LTNPTSRDLHRAIIVLKQVPSHVLPKKTALSIRIQDICVAFPDPFLREG